MSVAELIEQAVTGLGYEFVDLETSPRGRLLRVFIDADKEGYADYLAKLLPLVRPGGLILAHNIGSRSQNPEYMDAVTANPNLETIRVNSQMAVTLKKR